MMSVVAYSEPYKLPAGILALVVHAVFLVLLYFGVKWQAQPPQGMVVDIWKSLPAPETPPAKVEPPSVQPPPVEKVEPPKPVAAPKRVEPARPVAPPKADIELAKKKQPPKPLEPKKPPEIRKQVEEKQPVKAAKPVEAPRPVAPTISETERAEQNARAEQVAAIGKVVDEYKARIVAKIRRNIVLPPDVPDSARAEFDVTLLPGGPVLNAKLVKSSGHAAYDSAVERAIIKAQPLPLPPDATLFSKFRELHLKFSPVE